VSKSPNNLDLPESHKVLFLYGSSGDPELEELMILVLRECYQLWCERHRKYGRLNISKFGEYGCLVRASDKLERLINSRHVNCADETVEDSWKDLLNYAAMALLCRRGQWPTS